MLQGTLTNFYFEALGLRDPNHNNLFVLILFEVVEMLHMILVMCYWWSGYAIMPIIFKFNLNVISKIKFVKALGSVAYRLFPPY